MGKVAEFFNRKVFGVKVLYLAAVVVAVLVFFAWKMKPATEPSEEDAGTGDAATGEEPSQPTFSAVGEGGGAGGVVGGVEDTNDMWGRRAIEWLIGQGKGIDKSTIAIQKYLNGDALSDDEAALKDLAVGQFGLPPEIPQSGGTQTDPVTPPIDPGTGSGGGSSTAQHIPPGYHTVKGSNEGYQSIAKMWYGSTDDKWVDLIQGWNKYDKRDGKTPLPHSGPLPVGAKLWIPAKKEPVYATAKKGLQAESDFIKKYPPLHQKMLQEFNDGMHFPVPVGTKVRVA
jgi:hypothetical protein